MDRLKVYVYFNLDAATAETKEKFVKGSFSMRFISARIKTGTPSHKSPPR